MKLVATLGPGTILEIKKVISRYTHVSPDEFNKIGPSGKITKERPYAISRQLLAALIYRNTRSSMATVGAMIGDHTFSHATVLSSIRKVNKMILRAESPHPGLLPLGSVFDTMNSEVAHIIGTSDLRDKYDSIKDELSTRIAYHRAELEKYMNMLSSMKNSGSYNTFESWYDRFSSKVSDLRLDDIRHDFDMKGAWISGKSPEEYASDISRKINNVRLNGIKIEE